MIRFDQFLDFGKFRFDCFNNKKMFILIFEFAAPFVKRPRFGDIDTSGQMKSDKYLTNFSGLGLRPAGDKNYYELLYLPVSPGNRL